MHLKMYTEIYQAKKIYIEIKQQLTEPQRDVDN